MSIEYYLICKKHKELVWCCSDGFSGPVLQCDRTLAAFVITHRNCSISIIDEYEKEEMEETGKYRCCHDENWQDILSYEND